MSLLRPIVMLVTRPEAISCFNLVVPTPSWVAALWDRQHHRLRNMMDYVLYHRCATVLAGLLDNQSMARCQLEGAANSVSDALDAELGRLK